MPRRLVPIALAVLVLCPVSALGEGEIPPWIRFVPERPGWHNTMPALRRTDPVTSLTDEERKRYAKGLSDTFCMDLQKAYVNRLEKTYTSLVAPPEGLLAWLSEHPDIRQDFWSALSPYYDDLGAAMAVMNIIRQDDPELAVRYAHLAIALALVWDTENAIIGSRYRCIWGLKASQFLPTLRPLEVFRYFTDKKRERKFAFRIADLVWPLLIHLVDFDVTETEAVWAMERMAKFKKRVGSIYSMVPYDYQKLNSRQSKLADRYYTLANLLHYGGVCGDQAHFCSRVAKCFGIPAFKASGLSRYGGQGHAFACYFIAKKGRPILASTGRYFHDFYYTGDVFDPQTRTLVLDRTVALMLDGATLSYDKYMLSQMLVRIAIKEYDDHPDISLVLTKKALTENWFCDPGWRLLMRHVKDGRMPPKEAVRWSNNMMKYVKDHPDLTHDCFGTFLSCIPKEETKKRQGFYKQALRLYDERPDLQITLNLRRGLELVEAGEESEATLVFLSTAAEHGKQGRILLPVVEQGVKLVKARNMQRKALPFLDKLVKKFPQKRGGKIAKAFQDLVRMVAPLYEDAGKMDDASRLRAKAGL
jgi:hypothetical protein